MGSERAEHWVLVVDDESEARELICDTLDVAGCRAVGALDGRAAQACLEAKQTPPCLIVLDLMMPGMNGWQFREWQRTQPRFSGIPVIVLSAVRDLLDQARTLDVECLAKPMSFQGLLEKVHKHCICDEA